MSRFSICSSIPLLGVFALSASAQPPAFSGPLAGFVFRPASQSVRPIVGVPGASYLASSVLSNIDSASISPDGKWALVNTDRAVLIQGLATGTAVEATPSGLIQHVDRVLWNRDGSFALLYSSFTAQLQRLSLSDSGAAVAPPLDLSEWGDPSALAIDPTGRQVVFGISGVGIFLTRDWQAPTLLSSMAQPAALAFDDSGLRLYAIDSGRQQILEFDSGSGPMLFAVVAESDGSNPNPVGMAVSNGGSYLMVVDRTSRSVWVYDTSSRDLVKTVMLDFTPSRFDALSARPSFLLNGDNSQEWLLILDARQTPGVYFVPADQERL